MKKLIAFTAAMVILAAAAVGGTVAYTPEAQVQTQVYSTASVYITFANTKLDSSVKILPGTAVKKTVQIKNMAGSQAAWVWFSVTVPAVSEGQPLVRIGGTEAGWVLLDTAFDSDRITYYYGYDAVLSADSVTTAGMTELTFSNYIDRVDGKYYLVINGEMVSVSNALDRLTIAFDAYSVAASAEIKTIQQAYSIWGNQSNK